MPIFTKKPSYASGGKRVFKVTELAFGDGYTQRSRNSINSQMLEYSLRFNSRRKEELSGVDAFLAAMGGVTAFEWNPPPPHNYADALLYDGLLPYPSGSVVKDVTGNAFTAIKDNNPGAYLLDPESWVFSARLPLKWLCSEVSWSFDEFNRHSLNTTFRQVFEP